LMNQENIENILGDKASYERAEVVKIINDVLEKVKVDDRNSAHGSNSEIVAELTNLKSVIEETKDEVARLGATDINSTHIPTATDELDAVVGATEVATGTIMDACEAIQTLSSGLSEKEIVSNIQDQVTKVYEACSFQDITGQRISKVVSTLKEIDDKVRHILKMLGHEVSKDAVRREKSVDINDKDSLLNGPQMPDSTPTQEDIDKLLADFD